MGTTELAEGRVVLHGADCRDVLRGLADNSIDSVVTDPPYALVSIVKRFGKPGSAPANGDGLQPFGTRLHGKNLGHWRSRFCR
jgi:DNA modification methylase